MIEPAELMSELFDIPFIRRSRPKIQTAIASFSAGAFHRQLALIDNPGYLGPPSNENPECTHALKADAEYHFQIYLD